MKTTLEKLKERYHNARTEKERAMIDIEIQKIADEDPQGFSMAMISLAKDTADSAEELSVKEQIKDILPAISLAYIAKNYFGKTKQWLYQRLNGSIVNGKPAKLNKDEIKTLESAFKDLSSKLNSIHVSS